MCECMQGKTQSHSIHGHFYNSRRKINVTERHSASANQQHGHFGKKHTVATGTLQKREQGELNGGKNEKCEEV